MKHPHIKWQNHEERFIVFLVITAIAGLLYISSGFLLNFVFASIVTLSTYPFFLKIKNKFNLTRTQAALSTTLGVGLILITPIAYMLTILGIEGASIYGLVEEHISKIDFSSKENTVNSVLSIVDLSPEYTETVRNILINHVDIKSVIEIGKNSLLFVSQNAIGGVFGTFGFFIFSLFIMFFLYRDGETIAEKIKAISPLHDYYDTLLMREMARLSGILTLSILSLAFIQGLSFSIVAFFLDLNWLFLGVAIALTSFIPFVGTFLVWFPLGCYLYLTGNEVQGVFIVAWGAIVTATIIDNVLRPFIVSYICKLFESSDEKLRDEEKDNFNPLDHTLIVVISTLGGILHFSILGLFIGPIVAGISIAILEIYRIRLSSMQEISDELDNDEQAKKEIDKAQKMLDQANEDNFDFNHVETSPIVESLDYMDDLDEMNDLEGMEGMEGLDETDELNELLDKEFNDIEDDFNDLKEEVEKSDKEFDKINNEINSLDEEDK
jgi:predicted PurR-regulated permease PerM